MINKATILPNQFVIYGNTGYDSHVLRWLMAEKELDYGFYYIPHGHRPLELAELNPYQTLPILVNRDIALYEFMTIFEYLEERHPAIKLLPNTPKDRANIRQLLFRIRQDWLSLAHTLLKHHDSMDSDQRKHAKKTLTDTLTTISPLFARNAYFLSDTFGICDIVLLPMLWRLNDMQIELPRHLCQEIFAYKDKLSARMAFQQTLNLPPLMELDDD